MILSVEIFLCESRCLVQRLGWAGFVNSPRLSVKACDKNVREWKGYPIVLSRSSMFQQLDRSCRCSPGK
jgi:hypothetical protein